MSEVPIGASAALDFVVREDDTAAQLGSGALPVLGTPRLLAWFEQATCAAIDAHLSEGSTTVGTSVELSHRAPSRVESGVRVEAEVSGVHKARITFVASAFDSRSEALLATATIVRAVVDIDAFMAKNR